MYSCTQIETTVHPCGWNNDTALKTVVDCTLKELPSIPCGLPPSTYRLKLSQNRITQIRMGELDNLPWMQTLELESNPLTSLAKYSFRAVTNLTELSLLQTHMEIIDDFTFTGLSSLVVLKLDFGKLTAIQPFAFDGLAALKYLTLKNNYIQELPSRLFEPTPNMIKLYLQSNNIQRIWNDTFINLAALEDLYLENNVLAQIPPFAFADLVSLRSLQLQNNRIQELTSDSFVGLGSLEYLDLRLNLISSVSQSAFEHMKNVKYINLESNSIQILHSDWFLKPSLVSSTTQNALNLQDNKWDCGCRATAFKLWISDEKSLTEFRRLSGVTDLKCATPVYMANYTLNDLDLSWFPETANKAHLCKAPNSLWQSVSNSKNVRRTHTLTLQCNIDDGYPSPKYVWQTPTNETIESANGTLIVENIQDEDNGNYLCQAINIVGIGKERFSVAAMWEFAEVDELGNYIGITFNNCRKGSKIAHYITLLFILTLFL